MDNMMLNAREHEKQVEEEKERERQKEYRNMKQGLFDQMREKQEQQAEAYQEYLKERDQVNAAAARIREEDLM